MTLWPSGYIMDPTLNRALFGSDTLPQQTGALVKRAAAYLHQNQARLLVRRQIAGVSPQAFRAGQPT